LKTLDPKQTVCASPIIFFTLIWEKMLTQKTKIEMQKKKQPLQSYTPHLESQFALKWN